MAQAFAREAELVVGRVLGSDGEFDAVSAICRPFVYKVLPDLLGLPEAGREHMEAFGHMVWATMGPMNELFREAMHGSEPVLAWVEDCCNREKATIDLLVTHGIIQGDSQHYVREVTMGWASDVEGIRITIRPWEE